MKRGKLILQSGLLAGLWIVAGLLFGLAAFVRDIPVEVTIQYIKGPPAVRTLDALVVLTGGSNRVDTGFDLLEKGFAKKLFISGVYRGNEIKHLLNQWKEIPQEKIDCCVALGFEADNTAGNAVETAHWMTKEQVRSIYLVTSNYHMQRALLEFKKAAPDVEIVSFSVFPDKWDRQSWWKSPATRRLVLKEYMKYIAVYLRYSMLPS